MLQTIPSQPNLVLRHKQATAPQRAFWRSGARFRLFVGGVGSGKTRAGCVEILRQPTKSVGMVVAPTYPMLRDATMRTFIDLARRGGVLQAFQKAEMQATLIDGKRILFRSADDPDRLRGPNLGWFYLDEAALMDADVWPIMIGRLRELPGRAWATSTPRGFNWMHEVFVKGGADYHVTRSATRDNVYLPDGFLRSLEQSYDTAWAAQELEGEFLDLGAIDHFLPSMHLWDACQEAIEPLDGHTPCILALDGAESNDTFATVIVSKHGADRYAVRYVRPYVPTPGKLLDFDAIEADIRVLCQRYAIQQIAYDPALIRQNINHLTTGPDAITVECVPFPQGAARLESDKALYDLITTRRLAYDASMEHAADLRAHVANANKKIDTEGRKLRIVKRTYQAKIDLCVALAMAAARAAELIPRTLTTGDNYLADWRG
jgi:hypothetical protein